MSFLTHQITITEEENSQRIDKIYASRLINKDLGNSDISRSRIQKHGIFSVQDTVSNTWVSKTGKSIARRDECWKCVLHNETNSLKEKEIPELSVIKDSKTWAVINKPIGISVHPSPGDKDPVFITDMLSQHFGSKNLATSDDIASRPGIVHRLDKGTSGVMIIAKTVSTLEFLQNIWSTKVKKNYKAVVTGTVPEKGKIVSRIKTSGKKSIVLPLSDTQGKYAETHFLRENTKGKNTTLNVSLVTGRTHQIRAHLSSIGYPIIGDTLYGGEKFSRILLHAQTLEFPDIDNQEKIITVNAPIPEIMCSV